MSKERLALPCLLLGKERIESLVSWLSYCYPGRYCREWHGGGRGEERRRPTRRGGEGRWSSKATHLLFPDSVALPSLSPAPFSSHSTACPHHQLDPSAIASYPSSCVPAGPLPTKEIFLKHKSSQTSCTYLKSQYSRGWSRKIAGSWRPP